MAGAFLFSVNTGEKSPFLSKNNSDGAGLFCINEVFEKTEPALFVKEYIGEKSPFKSY